MQNSSQIKEITQEQEQELLAATDYESGEIYWEEHEQYDEKMCLSFLKNIVEKYPEGKTVIILDYARIYHAKLIQPFLKENVERFIRSEQSNSPSDSFPQIATSPFGLIGSPGTAPCHRAHEGNEGKAAA